MLGSAARVIEAVVIQHYSSGRSGTLLHTELYYHYIKLYMQLSCWAEKEMGKRAQLMKSDMLSVF